MTAMVKSISLMRVYYVDLEPPFVTNERFPGGPVEITDYLVKVYEEDRDVSIEPYGYQLRKDGGRKGGTSHGFRSLSHDDLEALGTLFLNAKVGG